MTIRRDRLFLSNSVGTEISHIRTCGGRSFVVGLFRRNRLFLRVRANKATCNHSLFDVGNRFTKGGASNVRGGVHFLRRSFSTCQGRFKVAKAYARCLCVSTARNYHASNCNGDRIISFYRRTLLLFRCGYSFATTFRNYTFNRSVSTYRFRYLFEQVKGYSVFRFFHEVGVNFHVNPSPIRSFRRELIFFRFSNVRKNRERQARAVSIRRNFCMFHGTQEVTLFPTACSRIRSNKVRARRKGLHAVCVEYGDGGRLRFQLKRIFRVVRRFCIYKGHTFRVLHAFVLCVRRRHH